MALLALVRHGESVSNLANIFTGNLDVVLTPAGEGQALAAGRKLHGIQFDAAFTSRLIRAERTLEIILGELGETEIRVYRDVALNERGYGSLQGLNKTAIAEKYGAAQLEEWRRSYAIAPPEGESLQQTQVRVVAYFTAQIAPLLRHDQRLLIVAHGNSLRALRMSLEGLTEEQIVLLKSPPAACTCMK